MVNTTEREAAIQLLLDKQEIHDCIVRYCRGVDRGDVELIRSAFHPDAYDDHGIRKGKPHELAEAQIQMSRHLFKSTTHFICNELVEVQGDVAYSESYALACHRFERDGKEYDLVTSGRYLDRFERRNGVWKIARRVCVIDWSRTDPVMEEWESMPSFIHGKRSHADPSYER